MSFPRLSFFSLTLLIAGAAGLLVVWRHQPSAPAGVVAGWTGVLPEAAMAAADPAATGIAVLVDDRLEPLVTTATTPDLVRLSADGRTIAWKELMAGRQSVIRYDLMAGRRQTVLTTKEQIDDLWLSAGGQYLAIQSRRRSPSPAVSLTVAGADGRIAAVFNQPMTGVAWTPSGRAFGMTRTDGVAYVDGSQGVWSAAQALPLGPAQALDWLDDRTLLLIETAESEQRLFAYDVASQTRRVIQTLAAAAPAVRLDLSPNRHFALIRWYDVDRFVSGMIVDVATGVSRPLPAVISAEWTRTGSLLAATAEADGRRLWLIDPVTLRSVMVDGLEAGAGQ